MMLINFSDTLVETSSCDGLKIKEKVSFKSKIIFRLVDNN